MVIGIPADLRLIITNAPLILLFVFIIAISNLAVSLAVGKLFRVRLEEILLAVNATVGGPTTAAAMAIAKGWRELVAPIMLVGTLGYLIGNYVGTFMGNWFSSFYKRIFTLSSEYYVRETERSLYVKRTYHLYKTFRNRRC